MQEAIQQVTEAYSTVRLRRHDWHAEGVMDDARHYMQRIKYLIEVTLPDTAYTHKIAIQEEAISRLSGQVRVNLLLVLREAITNVIKHSGATFVSVELSEDTDAVLLVVKDNGRGFLYTEATEGMGLSSLRDRVSEIDGTLRIDSGSSGTEILVLIPVPDPE